MEIQFQFANEVVALFSNHFLIQQTFSLVGTDEPDDKKWTEGHKDRFFS